MFQILLPIVLGVALFGCGAETRQLTPVQEAYRLMDQGNNAKAVFVLEKELEENPENKEARQLLASAFVGLAGIDIYAIQEAFHDILFKSSLKDQFNRKGSGDQPVSPVPAAPPASPVPPAPPASPVPHAPTIEGEAEKTIRKLDKAILDLQKMAIYLARFPQIPEEKWIYLEKALTELAEFNDASDIAVYRILIRLIYVKSYLVQEVLRDEEFGTRAWACAFEPQKLHAGLSFVNGHILMMRADAVIAVRNGAKKLAKADSVLNEIVNATDLTESIFEIENSLAFGKGETRLRKTLKCTDN